MSKSPIAEHVQVNFRLPVTLRNRIRAAADRNGQSVTAELIDALERQFPAPQTPMDVVNDVATQLGFLDEELRQEAITALVKLAERGQLNSMAEGLALAFKHRD